MSGGGGSCQTLERGGEGNCHEMMESAVVMFMSVPI